jgi:hypothetical protein
MYELQTKFMVEILMKFLTRAETPLGVYRNSMPQDNNSPEALNLIQVDGSQTRSDCCACYQIPNSACI